MATDGAVIMDGTSTAAQMAEEVVARGPRAVLAVSQHAGATAASSEQLLGALSRTIARLAGARRVAFWALQPDSRLLIQKQAFGFSERLLASMREQPCGRDADGLAFDVVFADRPWQGNRPQRDLRGAMVVPWRAGDQRLGVVGVYDSTRPAGFSPADLWVVRQAALTAGLVWQERLGARRLSDARRERERDQHRQRQRLAELENVRVGILDRAILELRTPLGVVRDCISELEQRAARAPAEVDRLLAKLQGRVDDMTTLLEEMVEAIRLGEGRSKLTLERLDLRDLVADACDAVNQRATPRHRLIIQPALQPVMIMGDRLRLHSVITNLLDNAVKYSPRGGPVHCGIQVERQAAILSVIDRGVGIAEADLPTLFTRFGRIVTRETKGIPGTGLGLYLAREMAVLHGGDIAVESRPGAGSAFRLVLPRLPEAAGGTNGNGRGRGRMLRAGHDITAFGLADMAACGAALRSAGAEAASFDDAATLMARYLYDNLHTSDPGERASVLVRLFRTVPYGRLNPEQQKVVQGQLRGRDPSPSLVCLALAASNGDVEAWNDPSRSEHHRLIPLPNGRTWPPMFAQLVHELGVHPSGPNDSELFMDAVDKNCNVFHVPQADGNPHLPAQEEFVRAHGVRSVLGFGGMLARQDLFFVVVFTRAPITPPCAALFRSIAYSAKLALERWASDPWTPARGPAGLRVLSGKGA
jgi:signal transduction histidine kinase